MNLFESDVEWFKHRFPVGYTEAIREVLKEHVRNKKEFEVWLDKPEVFNP